MVFKAHKASKTNTYRDLFQIIPMLAVSFSDIYIIYTIHVAVYFKSYFLIYLMSQANKNLSLKPGKR